MNANIPISMKLLATKPIPIEGEIVIGKDILDLLAGAMYVNPLDVYREYVQNAADAIDQALDSKLEFKDEPAVSISFNQTARSITIRDNGISIPTDDFVRRLTAIGGSQKRGTTLRGFRGVGRLSGLGYCQELIFRGRAEGDTKVTELRWDGRALREKLRDNSFQGSLTELIHSIVTVSTLPTSFGKEYPARFFEVELNKVSRLKNDMMLNEDTVRKYLAQVSPVSFSNQFSYAEEINAYLTGHGIRKPVKVEINDGIGEVIRNIQNLIVIREGLVDQIRGVEFIEYFGTDGELAAVGWIGDHSYYGALPKKQGLGGIRLRAGNIQVGDESILADFFPEVRFSGWAIGEIHIISRKILPNGRRDNFEPSSHYAHLQGEFAILAKQIVQRIREKSIKRNRLKTLNQHLVSVQEWVNMASTESLPRVVQSAIREIAHERLIMANTEVGKIQGDVDQHAMAVAKIAEVSSLVGEIGGAHKKGQRTEAEAMLASAIKAILGSASKPSEGVKLSVHVLNAIAG